MNKRYLILLSIALLGLLCYKPAPLTEGLSYSTALYDVRGRLLRLSLAKDGAFRLPIKLSKVSPYIKEATLLYEDRYFFLHPGVNLFSLLRAFVSTYITKDRIIGGSTITMQVARLRYGINTRSVWGKILQICTALWIEAFYSKDQILSAYLTLAPYGGNIYGIEAASIVYFKKHAKNINLSEALTLAVLPQNPVKRRPIRPTDKRNPLLIEARTRLSEIWLKRHPQDRDKITMADVGLEIYDRSSLPFLAPHFTDSILKKRHPTGNLITTLDLSIQKVIEASTFSYLRDISDTGVKNAAVIVVNHQNMNVEGLIGSGDFFNSTISGQIDGSNIKRSPGSTLKPFIYALALEQGLILPDSILRDVPHRFIGYNPQNYDRSFLGALSARSALINSRNLPAVELANKLNPSLYVFLKKAGINLSHDEKYYGLSLALGGGEVTMRELIKLYASLVNSGVSKDLRFLKGEKLSGGKHILTPQSAYIVYDMLLDNPDVYGLSKFINKRNKRVAWKTGTSFSLRDAWSIGIVGQYVIGVWLGDFMPRSNSNLVGRTLAGPLLFKIIDALKGSNLLKSVNYKRPPDVISVDVCSLSGALPSPYCPHRRKSLFIAGVSPIAPCRIHREVLISEASGLRVCRNTFNTSLLKVSHGAGSSRLIRRVYEFWPSEIAQVFSAANLTLNSPPPFMAGCNNLDTGSAEDMKIIYPLNGSKFIIPLGKSSFIDLKASAPAEAKRIYWFLNGKFLGSSKPSEPFAWQSEVGDIYLTARDDLGHSSSAKIKVTY
ncbi:MAG: penicillin-binding protein 1C [Candidatus Dadabacteria bacterium]|nr:MAG: penicillin-binding protein 1C [Candidatus Dadabacteria bacterium]